MPTICYPVYVKLMQVCFISYDGCTILCILILSLLIVLFFDQMVSLLGMRNIIGISWLLHPLSVPFLHVITGLSYNNYVSYFSTVFKYRQFFFEEPTIAYYDSAHV